MAASTLTTTAPGVAVRWDGAHQFVPGTRRRRIIGILIFVQAILVGSTTPIGNYSLL